MRTVAQHWGECLETPPSAQYVPDFQNDPNFGDWYCPADPYTTFQSFFTRELCAATFPNGSRPVERYSDPNTAVAIGDSTSAGWWQISGDGKLVTTYDGIAQSGKVIKGRLYNDAQKGWEFANFASGGSDFVVIFEERTGFVLTADQTPKVQPGAGVNYAQSWQGQRYGCFGGAASCSDVVDPAAQPDPIPADQ